MEYEKEIRIAIISDPHFYDPATNKNGTSWLNIEKADDERSLWKRLQKLIVDEQLTADALLSLGDITTYANTKALKFAWKSLINLGADLGSQVLISATGNHDVCSRGKKEIVSTKDLEKPTELFENLKLLDPHYPIHRYKNQDDMEAHQTRIHYFGANYAIYDDDDRFRVMVINSCANHTTESLEQEMGRINHSTLSWIDNELSKFQELPNKINIAICHHSPIAHENYGAGTFDLIHNGQLFLEQLNKNGDWIVFHGHKHIPKITQQNDCFIFSSASLAAQSHDCENQFYILKIYLLKAGGIRCSINAWNWYEKLGWVKAEKIDSGIWDSCGFGFRGHADEVADNIANKFLDFPVKWNDVKSKYVDLHYITPDLFTKLNASLRKKHNLNIVCNERGPLEITRITK